MRQLMKMFVESQELVNRFNEDASVWREYAYLRQLHRRRRGKTILNRLLDRIHWLLAERKHRAVRCIGRTVS